MPAATVRDVLSACKRLSATQARAIFDSFGRGADRGAGLLLDDHLSDAEQTLLLLADVLFTVKLLSDLEVKLALKELGVDIILNFEELTKPGQATRLMQFVVVDRRFVTCTGSDKLYDLLDLKWVDSTPDFYVESVSYNLNRLHSEFLRGRTKSAAGTERPG